jgi:N-methylhydantoinase A/oxoprolinase/acetone carboxylase beta subunit
LRAADVLNAVKTPTTDDVTGGIARALAEVLQPETMRDGVISAVAIGTTHFVNAVVERRNLNRVAAVRICLPASASLPPFTGWPESLASVVNGGVYMVGGGHEVDGSLLAPLDERAVAQAAHRITEAGVSAVAVASVFSPLTDEFERRAAEILHDINPGLAITLSSEIGRIGLLERENASLINAALTDLARHTTEAFREALSKTGIDAPLYITQNDGTVAPVELARSFPVFSFASGPTNSMRGAAYLSGLEEAVVCDIGGTTTDVGSLHRGFPREANNVIEIGGVRTLFRMPDVYSLALGGGTIVDPATLAGTAAPVIGPESVGYRLESMARVFGGDTLTCTDLAVAAGLADIGDAAQVAGLAPELVDRGLRVIAQRLSDASDRMKSDSREVPLLAVGGGAMLMAEEIAGFSAIVRVRHHAVANAVGAAIAEVSGGTDKVYRDVPREEALADAEVLACEQAVASGADRTRGEAP